MLRAATPNRAVVFAVGGFVIYWIAAMLVPSATLRDVFNALAFGTAVVIVATWSSSAWRAVRSGADTGEWQLILAIFMVWLVVLAQRIYSILFNWYDRPEAWFNGPISGFWPYSFTIAGMLFLAAPGVEDNGFSKKSIVAMVASAAIGGIFAGVLIAKTISFD